MSGLETNLKSARPRPRHHETETTGLALNQDETKTTKICMETCVTG